MTSSPDATAAAPTAGAPAVAPPGEKTAPHRPPTGRGRDRYLDLWRAAALVRVVYYHIFGGAWLTLLFPAMGLMFTLGGSLMARSLDRGGRRAVGARLRRLLPPIWAFGLVAVGLLVYAGWRTPPPTTLGWADLVWWLFPARVPPVGGDAWAWTFVAVLWYITTYLWLVLLSPALLALFRRWPWPSLAAAVLLPVAMLFDVVTVGGYFAEQADHVSAYLALWMLGFAHHDGLLRRIPARRYALGVGVLAVAGAVWVCVAALTTTGTFDLNRIPAGKTLWSIAFVAAVLRFRPRVEWLERIKPLDRVVDLLNGRAVTIYLWHMPAALLAALLFTPSGFEPGVTEIVLRLALVWLLVGIAVVGFGWVEDLAARRRPTLLPRPSAPRAAGSGAAGTGDPPAPALPAGPTAPIGPTPATVAALVPAGPAVPPAVSVPPDRPVGRPAGHWNRLMVAGVAAVAVALAGAAAKVVPGPVGGNEQVQAENARYLSDMLLVVDGTPAVDQPEPEPRTRPGAVDLDGATYPNAVVVAAPSRLRVTPPTGCEQLRAVIAVADADADDVEVTFTVQADGEAVYGSGPRTRVSAAEQIDIGIPAATVVDLVATSATGNASAIWADARFVCPS
ncbi:acyltransferase family protein [Polymorphospora rubra]|uniref:acyltransferase family protein n=1 Tax=Polymorphospora rubra TaxID=338584 RepID=UPI00340E24D8